MYVECQEVSHQAEFSVTLTDFLAQEINVIDMKCHKRTHNPYSGVNRLLAHAPQDYIEMWITQEEIENPARVLYESNCKIGNDLFI